MSEFLAEARILVRPDTTAFRAELLAQLATATRGVTVPVSIVPSGSGAAATGFARLTQVQDDIKRRALEAAGATDVLEKSVARSTRRLGQFQAGAVASLASLTGLRGAVLAASGPFLAAAVAATSFLKSLQAFAQFETQLNVFAATTKATGEEMQAVGELARDLGADLSLPATSATDAATAMTELAKAGLSVEDAMAGARGVLQLSTAAGIDVGSAAQFAANQLNAFSLAGDQAVRVADVLANAAQSAQGDIGDFGLAFRQSAAVANQVGLTLEQTAAQLAIMARAGLQGSDAGTSLRVSLLRLINPTEKAKDVIEELGIQIRDVNGNVRPDVFIQFAEATRRMTPAARDAAAALVFGADGIRTFATSAQAGREGLVETTIQIGETGTAAIQAEARMAGFGGQLEGLQNTAGSAAVNLGEVSTILAGPLVAGLTAATAGLNQLLEPFADLVRLSKEKLGIGTFDPTTASAAELLAQIEELRSALPTLDESFEGVLEQRIRDAIRALEAQRATLKALGVDASGVNTVIRQLQADLANVGQAGEVGFSAAERAAQDLRETIEALGEAAPDSLRVALKAIEQQIALAAQEGGRFAERFERSFRDAAAGVDVLTQSLQRLRGELSASSDALLRAQNEGASPQAQIAILRGQEQTQRDIIATLKRDGIQPGDPTAIRKARQEIERIQGQIESLQRGIIADQEAAANEAERIAREAQQLRDRQFTAIANMFGERQENIQRAIDRASIEGNVQAQIRLNKALIASLQKERAALLERLRILKVSAEVRKRIMEAIDDAIEDARQEILRLQQTQNENIEQLLTTRIDLRIRIAQARDDTAQEIKLRRQRVQIITKELIRLKNAGKKNTIAWLELKAQQAEEIAAINDLIKQTQEGQGNARQRAAEFFFEQLQAQQGFAANLLGNIIPTAQTAGLVGVPSPDVRVRAEASGARGRSLTSPTSGQVSTTNDILLRILEQLKNLNNSASAPEAVYQKKMGAAAMTGGGGNVEVM